MDEGARKMSQAPSCHELQSLFWEFSPGLGIVPYKHSYISFLRQSIIGMSTLTASSRASEAGPKGLPKKWELGGSLSTSCLD